MTNGAPGATPPSFASEAATAMIAEDRRKGEKLGCCYDPILGPTGAILTAGDKPTGGVGKGITTRLVYAGWNGECGQDRRH